MPSTSSKLPRSPAQAIASRLNGRRSAGPKTTLGRAASSANALKTGLNAHAVAMPWEKPERIQEIVAGWMGSFPINSFAATELARRGAHIAVSIERAEHLREKTLSVLLEERVAESDATRALALARETRDAVAGLAALAEEVHTPVPRERAEKLAIPVQRVVQAVLELELPPGIAYPIATAAGVLAGDHVTDVPADVFVAIASGARAVLEAIDATLPTLILDVENERERLVEMLLVADDPRLRQIDRVRGRLLKELDCLLRALRSLRELENSGAPGSGAPPVPVVVEFKSIGGSARQSLGVPDARS